MLHEEYHKFTVGEDGEIPLDALGSPPQTEMGSFLYSGPSADMADTVSLPRRWRVHQHPRARHPDLPIVDPLCPEHILMGLWIVRLNLWPNFYPDRKTRM